MDYAIEVCSECHAVRDGERKSLISQTPSFEDNANFMRRLKIAIPAIADPSKSKMQPLV